MPTHVPVCVLGNYRDMGEHRVILPDDVRDFIEHLDRWVLPLLLWWCWGKLVDTGEAQAGLSCVGDKMIAPGQRG